MYTSSQSSSTRRKHECKYRLICRVVFRSVLIFHPFPWFFLSCFCSETRSYLIEKKSKWAARCPLNTVLSTASYFDITDEGSYIDTGALVSKPSSFHLPLQLPLPHEVVPHVDEVTLHWSRKLRNHILDRRLSR